MQSAHRPAGPTNRVGLYRQQTGAVCPYTCKLTRQLQPPPAKMPLPYTPQIVGSSIVAVGDFNPAIFSPDWLHRNQLIGDGDHQAALSAETVLVSRRVSVCETDWFHLQILENQLVLLSKGALTPALKDLAEGIFLLVTHTPITAVGINFHAHYQMTSMADLHKVGDVLAPKVVWGELFNTAKYSSGLMDLQIKIQQGARDVQEPSNDAIHIQIQPSNQIKTGIYFMLNDHRVSFAKGESDKTAAERAAALVAREWEQTWAFATQTFESLLSKVLASGG